MGDGRLVCVCVCVCVSSQLVHLLIVPFLMTYLPFHRDGLFSLPPKPFLQVRCSLIHLLWGTTHTVWGSTKVCVCVYLCVCVCLCVSLSPSCYSLSHAPPSLLPLPFPCPLSPACPSLSPSCCTLSPAPPSPLPLPLPCPISLLLLPCPPLLV